MICIFYTSAVFALQNVRSVALIIEFEVTPKKLDGLTLIRGGLVLFVKLMLKGKNRLFFPFQTFKYVV